MRFCEYARRRPSGQVPAAPPLCGPACFSSKCFVGSQKNSVHTLFFYLLLPILYLLCVLLGLLLLLSLLLLVLLLLCYAYGGFAPLKHHPPKGKGGWWCLKPENEEARRCLKPENEENFSFKGCGAEAPPAKIFSKTYHIKIRKLSKSNQAEAYTNTALYAPPAQRPHVIAMTSL